MKTKNLKYILVLITIFILSGAGYTNVFSQDEGSELDNKIKDVKGDVEKIVISTSEGDFEFEGSEAEMLFKRIGSHHGFTLLTEDEHGGRKGKRKMVFIGPRDTENVFIVKEDGSSHGLHGLKELNKEINVEVEDGVKKVTVTTREGGEEKVEVFRGDEADEFLEKHKAGGDDDLIWISEDDSAGNMIKVIVTDDDDSDANVFFFEDEFEGEEGVEKVEKKIEVTEDDGVKKVTVTTTKDGKETVETYEGDEADEFLKKHKQGKKMRIMKLGGDDDVFEIEMDHGKHKKIKKIIIEKEIEEDDDSD